MKEDNFEIIKDKLESFIKKYHKNELIRGVILFVTIGVLYFIITLLIEYFLWLNVLGRTILFWLFITVELFLFIKFIAIPLTRLFKITKGINFLHSSKIIGEFFPEVNDKLLNLLQLKNNDKQSSLLLASIEQKSLDLKPIPFNMAVDFKSNIKYLKYAFIPVFVFLLASVFNLDWFSESYSRVVNYEIAYEPPAPFHFYILNSDLKGLENQDYILRIGTTGDIIPENAIIEYNDEKYFLKNTQYGEFEYKFVRPKKSVDFTISSNDVSSKQYTLNVVSVPSLLDFIMELEYPKYLNKSNELIKSSGNATIPEGTNINWKIFTQNTENVTMLYKDTLVSFSQQGTEFSYRTRLFNDLNYEISTSNRNVKNHDNLSFNIDVVKDQFPELIISSKIDSTDVSSYYFHGRASDDYGLTKLRLVYYNVNNSSLKEYKDLPINQTVFDEFIYAFPGDIKLNDGEAYEFYFEVFDNDALHNYKSSKSKVYDFNVLDKTELDKKRLEEQSKAISGLKKSLKKFNNQQDELKSISKLQKEKKQLDFNDKKKLADYLKRQKEQEKMMNNFTKKLKDNLEKSDKKAKEEPFKDALKEMLERNELRLKKNEKLLEEINKIAEKINKEELTEKLDKLGKENKNLNKNLEQLLELTKRYYVIEKQEKLADKLDALAKEQEKLAEKNGEDNSVKEQEKLNKEFEEFQKGMDELRKDNKDLKKPMKLHQKESEEDGIKNDQKKAKEELKKQEQEQAKKNQKSAAQKMKQMSSKMKSTMQMGGSGSQQQEDIEMLRQILDNLVDYSIEQENLMKDFKGMSIDNPMYSSKLKKQSVLRENFIHIDDSLYALAMRTPKITDEVTTKLTDIEYNIDKSLERLAENQVSRGSANQQYAVTGSNDLAYFLSKALEQMQNSMSGASGKGSKSKGFQLPDIIKKQEELNNEMKEGSKKSKGEKEGKGKEGKKEEGQKGKDGSGKGGEMKDGSKPNNKDGKDGKKGGKNKSGKGNDSKEGNKQGNKKEGVSENLNEDLNGQLFEIYKQQQQLRNALQDKLSKEGKRNPRGSALLRKMEQVEQELLEKGFNENTLSKMIDLKHELLKIDDATLEQGKKQERESNTNKEVFKNNIYSDIEKAKQYFNTTEILNRQVLPLRQNYKQRVQEYFKKEND